MITININRYYQSTLASVVACIGSLFYMTAIDCHFLWPQLSHSGCPHVTDNGRKRQTVV